MSLLRFPPLQADRCNHAYTRPVLLGILVLAAVLRFAYLIELQDNPLPKMMMHNQMFDQYHYAAMAEDIMHNHWLTTSHPGHSPGYPYLLAAIFNIFGADMNNVFIFQMMFGVFAVYIVYRCSVLMFANKNLGLWAAFFSAMYSPLIFYECALLRESVTAYTNLSVFYFLLLASRKHKLKNYFITGMLSGLSLILHVGPLPLVVLFCVLCLKNGSNWKKRLIRCGFVLAGVTIIVAPLTIRNDPAGFKALWETSDSTLFWVGNSYDSPGIGLTYTPTQKMLAAQVQGNISQTFHVLFQEIQKHPQDYFELYVRKFTMLLNGYEIPANFSYDLFKQQSWILKIAFANFTMVAPLAILGIILSFRKFASVGPMLAFILGLSVWILIFHILSRYRIPVIPFYILAASYGFLGIWQMASHQQARPLGGALILLFLLVAFSLPNQMVMQRYFDGGIRGVDYANMAGAYLFYLENNRLVKNKSEILNKAIENYDKALPYLAEDDRVSVYITRAMVYRDLKLKVHAIDSLVKALEIDPENPLALKEYRMLGVRIIKK